MYKNECMLGVELAFGCAKNAICHSFILIHLTLP